MKFAPTALALFAFYGLSFADEVPSHEGVIASVVEAANKYANSITCGIEPITAEDIITFKPYLGDFETRLDAMYGVLWYGDIGCAGGSGTTTPNISIIKIGPGDSAYIDPWESSPAVGFPVGPAFDSVVHNTENSLIVEAREHADGDPNNFPSQRVRYTLVQGEEGNWRVTEKVLIQ